MTLSEEQVEWIVVEVLRRLGALPSEKAPVQSDKTLQVTDRVITMKLIEGRLAGVDRLVVLKKAVVTPAVKDELRRRKVTITFEETEH
jgi:hypothetical protein